MLSDALNWLFARLSLGLSPHVSVDGSAFAVLHKDQVLTPVRSPVQARRHVYADLQDFASAVNRRLAVDDADVLFDVAADTITATGHARDMRSDVLSCELRLHPRWKRWADLIGRKLDQRTFYRHLISTPPGDTEIVTAPGGQELGRESLIVAQDIGALKIVKGSTFAGELDPRGFYRVRDLSSTVEASAKIPSQMTIHVPMYLLGEPEFDENGAPVDARGQTYAITLEIEVVTDQAAPLFVLTCPALDLVRHAAQQDAMALLRSLLEPGFLVGLGHYEVETVAV